MKEYVRKNFPSHSLLDYALAVEKVTTSKKDTVSLRDFDFGAQCSDFPSSSSFLTWTDVSPSHL